MVKAQTQTQKKNQPKTIVLIPPPQVLPNHFPVSPSHLHCEDGPLDIEMRYPLIWWLPLKVLILTILQPDTAPEYKGENLKDGLAKQVPQARKHGSQARKHGS